MNKYRILIKLPDGKTVYALAYDENLNSAAQEFHYIIHTSETITVYDMDNKKLLIPTDSILHYRVVPVEVSGAI